MGSSKEDVAEELSESDDFVEACEEMGGEPDFIVNRNEMKVCILKLGQDKTGITEKGNMFPVES